MKNLEKIRMPRNKHSLSLKVKVVLKLSLVLIPFSLSQNAFGEMAKLKDLANVKGVRSNHLLGYGLVVGLQGTGDTRASLSTNRSTANLLTRLGISVNSDEVMAGNVAAVVASVELPSFARSGDKVDVRVSAIGDSKSLAGATLLLTPLKAGDGNIYVVAQGPVTVGQANGVGAQVLTVASVPGGGYVEREFTPVLGADNILQLTLKQVDFTTNARVARAINQHLRGFYAESIDPKLVQVMIPPSYMGRFVEFVAELENLRVDVDRKAMVVLNERTGTVVMGSEATVGPVTISHGNLSIQVEGGPTGKKGSETVVNIEGTNIGQLVETLNQLGVKPQDLVSIIQAIHAAGALQAELKVL
jgi:flagellar P-ring protein precursor FlgI